MRVLIVGCTGTIGGRAVLHLQPLGHDVSIAGRHPPPETIALVRLPFDAIVFAAGHNIRHVPEGENFDQHVLRVNGEAIPQFARLARDAGVKHSVYIGSFYPRIVRDSIDANAYVRSRTLAADGIISLAGEEFHACVLEGPFIVGVVPRMSTPMLKAYVLCAKEDLGIPFFGPLGGSNFMSTQSLSEAIACALVHGELAKAYLLGDDYLASQGISKSSLMLSVITRLFHRSTKNTHCYLMRSFLRVEKIRYHMNQTQPMSRDLAIAVAMSVDQVLKLSPCSS